MRSPVRYVGRLGGPGVGDDLSGPSTIDRVFSGVGVIIDDAVSFPWHLTDEEHDREPILVDLTRTGEADLTALMPALEVLTPSDRVVASAEKANALAAKLDLPSTVFLDEMPADPTSLLAGLRMAKLTVHLLRLGLEPILDRELGAAGSRVHQVGGADSWLASVVAEQHHFETSERLADLDRQCCDILIVRTQSMDLPDMRTAAVGLVPGGLLVFVLDNPAARNPNSLTMGRLVELLRGAFGSQFLFEHVWGLHERPGRPIVGGIVAVRPLGGALGAT